MQQLDPDFKEDFRNHLKIDDKKRDGNCWIKVNWFNKLWIFIIDLSNSYKIILYF